MDRALAIEDAFDRERTEVKNAPRTLDVDLIVVGDRRSDDDVAAPAPPAGRASAPSCCALARRRAGRRVPRPRPRRRPAREDRPERASRAATTWSSRSSDRRPPERDPSGARPVRARSRRRRAAATRRPRPRWSGGPASAWSAAGCCTRSRSACRAPPRSSPGPRPLALFLMAARRSAPSPWRTWREVHVRRERLEPHRAVNRLVLARACALVGALVAGGYLGYADQLARRRRRAGRAAGLAIGDRGARRCGDRHDGDGPRACVSRPFRRRRALTCLHVFPHSASPPARRRQRSTRLTVAVALIVLVGGRRPRCRPQRLVAAGHARRAAQRRARWRRHPDHPLRADGDPP